MAIATTTSRRNVVALLQSQLGTGWPGWFRAIVCGEDVALKKPHPEVYLRALALLQVPAREALAVEDSPAGVAAARAAGIAVLVTRSAYFADAKFTGATAEGPGLHQATGWLPALPAPGTGVGNVGLAALARWHASAPNRTGHAATAPKPD
jgi:beta-phosphoglucomutase-like phosphatase (HAD superfamily)